MFFAKTSKTLQLQIIKIVIKALHQKEIIKPMEEEFLILVQECCEELKQTLKGKGKDQNKDFAHIANVDKLKEKGLKELAEHFEIEFVSIEETLPLIKERIEKAE